MYPPLRNAAEWVKDYNTTYRGGPQGIGKWLEHAKSVKRPLSIPEWAVNNSTPLKSYYGGDNPYFVSQMLKFFKDNANYIGYECYFNANNINLSRDHLLDPAHNPQATKAYADFFAQTAG